MWVQPFFTAPLMIPKYTCHTFFCWTVKLSAKLCQISPTMHIVFDFYHFQFTSQLELSNYFKISTAVHKSCDHILSKFLYFSQLILNNQVQKSQNNTNENDKVLQTLFFSSHKQNIYKYIYLFTCVLHIISVISNNYAIHE